MLQILFKLILIIILYKFKYYDIETDHNPVMMYWIRMILTVTVTAQMMTKIHTHNLMKMCGFSLTITSISYMLSRPQHHGCFTHTLQLVVDGLKEGKRVTSFKSVRNWLPILDDLLLSLKFWKMKTEYNLPMIPRWNLQLKMIRSNLKIPPDVLAKADLPLKLSTFQRSILEELMNILTSFEEATDFFQTQNIPSAG